MDRLDHVGAGGRCCRCRGASPRRRELRGGGRGGQSQRSRQLPVRRHAAAREHCRAAGGSGGEGVGATTEVAGRRGGWADPSQLLSSAGAAAVAQTAAEEVEPFRCPRPTRLCGLAPALPARPVAPTLLAAATVHTRGDGRIPVACHAAHHRRRPPADRVFAVTAPAFASRFDGLGRSNRTCRCRLPLSPPLPQPTRRPSSTLGTPVACHARRRLRGSAAAIVHPRPRCCPPCDSTADRSVAALSPAPLTAAAANTLHMTMSQ